MQVLQAVLLSNGNLKLAAERAGIPPNELLSQLTEHFAELQLQVRTTLLVQTFGTLMLVQEVFKASLEDIEPKDIARAYIGLAASVAALSEPAKNEQNINLFDSIVMALPEEQREAFKALTAKTVEGSNENINDSAD